MENETVTFKLCCLNQIAHILSFHPPLLSSLLTKAINIEHKESLMLVVFSSVASLIHFSFELFSSQGESITKDGSKVTFFSYSN